MEITNLWKKDKRRIDLERVNERFPLRLTKKELEFVHKQALEECSNANSIIRKALKGYQNKVNSDE